MPILVDNLSSLKWLLENGPKYHYCVTPSGADSFIDEVEKIFFVKGQKNLEKTTELVNQFCQSCKDEKRILLAQIGNFTEVPLYINKQTSELFQYHQPKALAFLRHFFGRKKKKDVQLGTDFLEFFDNNSLEKISNKLLTVLEKQARVIPYASDISSFKASTKLISEQLVQNPITIRLLENEKFKIEDAITVVKELTVLKGVQLSEEEVENLVVKSLIRNVEPSVAKKIITTVEKNINIGFVELDKLLCSATALKEEKEKEIFFNIIDENLPFNEKIEKIENLLLNSLQNNYSERDLNEVKNDFTTLSQSVEFPIAKDELEDLVKKFSFIKDCQLALLCLDNQKFDNHKRAIFGELKKDPKNEENILYSLAILRELVRRLYGYIPYSIQMINVLAFLNDPSQRRMIQIKTGEGKSVINVILAGILSLQERKVDIVTTTRDLAKRDIKKYRPFFEELGFTVGLADSDADILFDIPYEYQCVFLYEAMGRKIVRGTRKYDVVIIDEVDSILGDMRNDYTFITSGINQHFDQRVYEKIWEYYEDKATEKTYAALSKYLENTISFNLNQSAFKKWTKSLDIAKKVKEGVNYVIEKNGLIRIVEYQSTGKKRLKLTEWKGGVHQFLQVKHKLKRTCERDLSASVTQGFLLNRYKCLYGLSGTLGTENERKRFARIYNVTYFDSPTYLPSKKQFLENIVVYDSEWATELVKTVQQIIQQGRPILIICNTINATQEVYNILSGYVKATIQLYNDFDEQQPSEVILALAGMPKTITIATNKAGRGTDIVTTPEVDKKGGLHVMVLFKPINACVEWQIFGRTGRQGKPGTCQYFLKISDLLSSQYQTHHSLSSTVYEEKLPSLGHRSTNKELTKLFCYWENKRDEANEQWNIQQDVLSEFLRIRDAAFRVFTSLPTDIKQKTLMSWGWCYTDIDALHEEITSECDLLNESKASDALNEATKGTIELFIRYWKGNHLSDLLAVKGINPLHYALSQGFFDIAETIKIYHPEYISEKNEKGQTPLEFKKEIDTTGINPLDHSIKKLEEIKQYEADLKKKKIADQKNKILCNAKLLSKPSATEKKLEAKESKLSEYQTSTNPVFTQGASVSSQSSSALLTSSLFASSMSSTQAGSAASTSQGSSKEHITTDSNKDSNKDSDERVEPIDDEIVEPIDDEIVGPVYDDEDQPSPKSK